MSNYNNLKTTIDANIKQNGNQEITGPILNSVLNQMVNILGTGYQFAGVATLDPATDPGTPDAKVFYIANGKGTYTNFGSLEVTEDEVVVLYWDSAWHKVSTGIASQAKLSELDKAVGDFSQKNTEEDGFYICDAEGNVLIRLDVLDTKGGIGDSLAASIKAIVQSVGADGFSKIEADELGENIKELIKNDAPDPVKMVAEDGFYICNEKGESVAKFVDEKWEFLNFNEYKPEPVKFGFVQKKGNIASGEKWIISSNSVKHDKIITFSGTFNEAFNSLTIGHGNHRYNKEESWIDVDETNITLHCINSGTSEYTGFPQVIPHGLSIKNNIQVEIDSTFNYKGKIKLVSNGHEFVTEDIHWWASSGDVFVTSSLNLSNCSFSWLPKTINGIWLFGDSYFTTGQNSKNRWTNYLFANGYKNFMLNGFPGATSINAYNDLIELLKIHTPEKIVWCMGMNNPDSDTAINDSWKSTTENVINICNENSIELILATIPTVVGGWNADTQSNNLGVHKYKNAYIKASGLRYIDFASAVGANETTGEWYNNGQSDDMLENYGVQGKGRIHPTNYGALALYHQAIADCPELCK